MFLCSRFTVPSPRCLDFLVWAGLSLSLSSCLLLVCWILLPAWVLPSQSLWTFAGIVLPPPSVDHSIVRALDFRLARLKQSIFGLMQPDDIKYFLTAEDHRMWLDIRDQAETWPWLALGTCQDISEWAPFLHMLQYSMGCCVSNFVP